MGVHTPREKLLETARSSREYQLYLTVRERVFAMLDNEPKTGDAVPSAYWRTELAGFDYMLDASPLIIQKLRHHTYHLTGLREYEYRKHHAYKSGPLEKRLAFLRARDAHNLFVPESSALGGFGYEIGGALVNADTLRFYEILLGLEQANILDEFRNTASRRAVLEIGSGWGGFAHQWKTLFPNTAYVLVDFPEALLFATTYLLYLFPKAHALFVEGGPESPREIIPDIYDFIFVPHFFWDKLRIPNAHLLVNMASFQEMTTVQVEAYLRKAREMKVPYVYSWNRDHSPNNPELTTVSSVMAKYFTVRPNEVFGAEKTETVAGALKRRIRSVFGREKVKDMNRAYRHLLGTRG